MSNIFNTELRRGGFTEIQRLLLKTLYASGEPLSMRAFEEKLDKKRLTILYNLKQLKKRGFVRQDRTGRIYTWVLEPLRNGVGSTEIPIERAYDILARSSSQKLWGIQGGGAVCLLTEAILKGTTYKPIHHRQRLRQVIVDGILTTGGVELIKQVPKPELASHLHRPTILHVTEDTPELSNLEILSDGKLLLVIDRHAETAAVVHDPLAVAAYIALHETIKMLSTKVRPQEVYGDPESFLPDKLKKKKYLR